jgi:aerobic C4-dicarboxylate transport protein
MPRHFYKNLTFQVLIAISIGLAIGVRRPEWGQALRPLGTGFIRLVTMVVGPIIFLTIVSGIASMGGIRKVGRVGGKALIYFEVITTLALAIGLLVANAVQPGKNGDKGIAVADLESENAHSPSGGSRNVKPAAAEAEVAKYSESAKQHSFVDTLLNVIPVSVVGAFAEGNLLQILFFAVLFGAAMSSLGLRESALMTWIDHVTEVMFRVVALIMKVAPLGALGAMAYTVGRFGLESLGPLVKLMACVYLTMALFIFVVLELVCRFWGFSLWRYLLFIREEIVLVLGTSSSESALPRMIEKLERLGCSRGVVGLVIPAGYSFNLDGRDVHRSGVWHRFERFATALPDVDSDADQQGRCRGHGRRICHLGGDARGNRAAADRRPGPAAGSRPFHERGPGHHQPDRQRRGHRGCQQNGRRV